MLLFIVGTLVFYLLNQMHHAVLLSDLLSGPICSVQIDPDEVRFRQKIGSLRDLHGAEQHCHVKVFWVCSNPEDPKEHLYGITTNTQHHYTFFFFFFIHSFFFFSRSIFSKKVLSLFMTQNSCKNVLSKIERYAMIFLVQCKIYFKWAFFCLCLKQKLRSCTFSQIYLLES